MHDTYQHNSCVQQNLSKTYTLYTLDLWCVQIQVSWVYEKARHLKQDSVLKHQSPSAEIYIL